MPFKSLEAKEEYNRLYYERNKIRINAERIIKDLKNNDQRCIRQTTMLKYDEGFDDNQLSFLTSLLQNCKLKGRFYMKCRHHNLS
jgi:hypothetical protein